MSNSDMASFPGRSNRYTSDRGYNPGQVGAGVAPVPDKPAAQVRGGQELANVNTRPPATGNGQGY